MTADSRASRISTREILFQLILHLVVFLFYAYDKDYPHVTWIQLAFFLNYALAALIINYILLPKFYYSKKQVLFFVSVIIIILAVVLVEELVLERIFYPDTRGRRLNSMFFTLGDVLPVIVILSGFKFAWDAISKQREVDTLKSAIKESELQFLKSQINPHFLFNNLNNLYSYTLENSPKAPEIILELSGVLRYMLYECRERYVPLEKELEQLGNFINLNEKQIEERGQVNFKTGEISSNYQIAPLILIVFIENAFKHSTASQTSDIQIDINIDLNDRGELEFNCKNSYLPQSNTENLSHGIGLENVKKAT